MHSVELPEPRTTDLIWYNLTEDNSGSGAGSSFGFDADVWLSDVAAEVVWWSFLGAAASSNSNTKPNQQHKRLAPSIITRRQSLHRAQKLQKYFKDTVGASITAVYLSYRIHHKPTTVNEHLPP